MYLSGGEKGRETLSHRGTIPVLQNATILKALELMLTWCSTRCSSNTHDAHIDGGRVSSHQFTTHIISQKDLQRIALEMLALSPISAQFVPSSAYLTVHHREQPSHKSLAGSSTRKACLACCTDSLKHFCCPRQLETTPPSDFQARRCTWSK